MPARHPIAQTIVILLSSALFGHFFLGLYFSVRLAMVVEWPRFAWFLLPYLGLTGLFVLSSFLAVRHLRWAAATLLFGLLLSALMCAYDLTHHRYQLVGGGTGQTYTIWWWYYEPFWYGYNPGNV